MKNVDSVETKTEDYKNGENEKESEKECEHDWLWVGFSDEECSKCGAIRKEVERGKVEEKEAE